MNTDIFIKLASVLSLAVQAQAISCYTCLRMEVSDGETYGPSRCKNHGLDYIEDDASTFGVCTKRLRLPAYETYYDDDDRTWETVLHDGTGDQFEDWACHKSRFTLESPESNVKVDVWYRGCQPIETDKGCTDNVEDNIVDRSSFRHVYANMTGTDYSRVQLVEGDECICRFFNCNAAQSNVASMLVMATTIATLCLVILI